MNGYHYLLPSVVVILLFPNTFCFQAGMHQMRSCTPHHTTLFHHFFNWTIMFWILKISWKCYFFWLKKASSSRQYKSLLLQMPVHLILPSNLLLWIQHSSPLKHSLTCLLLVSMRTVCEEMESSGDQWRQTHLVFSLYPGCSVQ